MARATEAGAHLQARDTQTETPSQTRPTQAPIDPATVRRNYPPLTTQFSVRDVCKYLFAEDGTSVFPDGVTVTYSTSDRYNDNFSSCQPSGYLTSYFQFSPGVCPSGWTYNDMRTTANGVSTAYCCASGFYYYSELTDCGSMAGYGPGTTAETRTTTDTRGKVHTETAKTLYLHRAWQVEWEASDTAQLSISLPELTSGTVIAAWEPSPTSIDDGFGRVNGSGGYHYENNGYSNGLKIPVTAIVVLTVVPTLFLIGGGLCFYRHRRERKRAKEQASQMPREGMVAGNEGATEQQQDQTESGGSRRQVRQMPRYL